MLDQFEPIKQFDSPEQLNSALDAEMNLAIKQVQDSTIPAEVDGVPFDHAGDIYSTEDDPELSEYVPPFDVDAVLQEIAG